MVSPSNQHLPYKTSFAWTEKDVADKMKLSLWDGWSWAHWEGTGGELGPTLIDVGRVMEGFKIP